MIHHRKHPEYVEGCKACKWATLSVQEVPGSHRESNHLSGMRQMDKNLHRYRHARKHGEHPRGTSKEAMDKSDKMRHTYEDNAKTIHGDNDPVQAALIKKTLLNES